MNTNKKGINKLFLLCLIIISLLNFLTIFSDSNKSNSILFEKIPDNLFYLTCPLIFELLQDNNNLLTSLSKEDLLLNEFLYNQLKEDKVYILEGLSENFNKKNYLVIKKDYKDLDKLFITSFLEYNEFDLFIDNETLSSSLYLNLKSINNNEMKNILFKAHIINENSTKKPFLKKVKVLKSRVQRAIKERSCNVIINLTNEKLDRSIETELFSKPFFIKSIIIKQRLYLLLATFTVILSLTFILKLSQSFNFISNTFLLVYIINSIFLFFYYIFSLIFNLNFHFLSFFLLYFQISTYFFYLFFTIKLIEKIEENEDINTLLLRFLIIFILTFLFSIIINTIFFSNLIYWLKPIQYLTYFFYFFPLIFLFILHYKQEKRKIIIYIISAFFLYFLFKLRDSGFFLTRTEIYVRDFLESFLPARFRFREFIFYLIFYFFLFIFIFDRKIIDKVIKFKTKYPIFFNYIIIFPFLSIINSYYHSYTPLYISYFRTIFALLFGFLFSGFVFLIFIGLIKLLKK